MKTVDEFATPIFKCRGEKLPLTEIVRRKKIVSITIKYKNKQKETITKKIENAGVIDIIYSETDVIIIRTRDKKSFQEIANNHDDSLYTQYISVLEKPYQLNLAIEGLIAVEWL